MTVPDSPFIFLSMVALISLSGVVMPGPVFAVTVARGYSDIRAGLKIAAGHSLIEIPLIVAVFLGFDILFKDHLALTIVGFSGGSLLILMGLKMIREKDELTERSNGVSGNSVIAGIITTAANPYFFLWWATIGATLIGTAVQFGIFMLPLFALVHTACDFCWEHLVSFLVFKTKGMWSVTGHTLLFIFSGVIMLVFGFYFIVTSIVNFN